MSNRNQTQTPPNGNQAVATIRGRDIVESQSMFTAEQIDLIKTQIAPPETTDDELMLFVQVANSRGLDPFRKHVYLVKRYDSARKAQKMAIQVSIDGLRLIAERSGVYEGQAAPRWCGPDGVWQDVWLGEGFPTAALVGVYRRGFREPIVAVARWSTYAQKTRDGDITSMWASMPDLMLAKCAEALALRKAFPEHAGGLYTQEEMDQARNGEIETSGRVSPGPNPRQAIATPTTEPTRDELKGQLWKLVSGSWQWTKEDLEGVSVYLTASQNGPGKKPGDMNVEELTGLYRGLVGSSPEQRQELLAKSRGEFKPAPLSDADGHDAPPPANAGEVIDVN